jgi:outer membrane protein assembly factor BamB
MPTRDAAALHRAPDVSRETFAADPIGRPATGPQHPRRRLALVLAAIGALGLAAAGCTRAASPQGWAPPEPVTPAGQQLIIAAHKGTLFALPPTSQSATWQFPPKDKSTYPVSQVTADQLNSKIDALGVSDSEKSSLKDKVSKLNVQGASITDLKNAVKASSASSSAKSDLSSTIDTLTKAESDALSSLQAFYGDIAVSTDGKTIYPTAFKGYVYALDAATGHMIWMHKVGSNMVGGTALSDGTIYFGSKGQQIFALKASNGEVVWQRDANGEIWSTPTVVDGSIYLTSLDGTVYSLKADGSPNWVVKPASGGIAGSPTIAGDNVFVGAFDNRLYSLKVSDGSTVWSYKAGNWFWGAPLVQQGVVYAANLDGKVYAVDATSGQAKWPKPFDTGSPVRSSPAVAGGGLVVANKAGDVYKIDLAAGTQVGSAFNAGSTIYANLTADNQAHVYVSPQAAQLFVLDATDNLKQVLLYGLNQ